MKSPGCPPNSEESPRTSACGQSTGSRSQSPPARRDAQFLCMSLTPPKAPPPYSRDDCSDAPSAPWAAAWGHLPGAPPPQRIAQHPASQIFPRPPADRSSSSTSSASCETTEPEFDVQALRRELAVKDEVLSLMTEQLRGMVGGQPPPADKPPPQPRQPEHGGIERAQQQQQLLRDAVQTAVAEAKSEWSFEADRLRACAKLLEAQRSEALGQVDDLRLQLDTLARAPEPEARKQASSNEDIIRQLADTLQARQKARLEPALDTRQQQAVVTESKAQQQLQSQLAVKEVEAREATEKAQRLEGEVLAVKDQLQGFTDHLHSHLLQKDEQMKRAAEQHAEELRLSDLKSEEIDRRAAVLDDALRAAKASATRDAEQKDSLLRAVEVQNEELQHEIDRLMTAGEEAALITRRYAERHVQALQAEMAASKQLTASLEQQLKEAHANALQHHETVAILQAKLIEAGSSSQQNENMKRQVTVLEKKIRELHEEVNEKARIGDEEHQITEELRSETTKMVLNLTAQLDEEERKRARLLSELEQERGSGRLLREQVAKEQDLTNGLRQHNVHLTEKMDKVQGELQASNESFEDLSAKLEEVAAQLNSKDAALASFQQACEAKDTEIAHLHALLEKSSEALDMLQETSESTRGEHSRKRAELAEKTTRLETENGRKDQELTRAATQLHDALRALAIEREAAATAEAKGKAEAARLQKALDSSKALFARAEEAREQLEQDLIQVTRDFTDKMCGREREVQAEINALRRSCHEKAHGTQAWRRAVDELQTDRLLRFSGVEHHLSRSRLQQEEELSRELLAVTKKKDFAVQEAGLRDGRYAALVNEMQRAEQEQRASGDKLREQAAAEGEHLKGELRAAKAALREKSRDAADSLRALTAVETALSAAKQEAAALQQRLERAGREHDEEAAENNRLAAELVGLQAAVAQKEALLDELQSRSGDQSSMVDHLRSLVRQAESQAFSLREQLAARESTLLERSHAILSMQESADQESGLMKLECEEMRCQLSATRRELSDFKEALDTKREELATRETQVARLESDLSAATTALSAVRSELSIKLLTIQTMDTEKRRVDMEVESLAKAAREKGEVLREKSVEVERLRLEKDDAIRKSSLATSEMQCSDLQRLQKQNELLGQLEAFKASAKKAQDELKNLRDQRSKEQESHAAVADKTVKELEALKKEHAQFVVLAKTKEEKISADHSSRAQEQAKIVEILRHDVRAKEAALRRMQQQLEESTTDAAGTDQASQAEKVIVELTNEVQRLRAEAAKKDDHLKAHATVTGVHDQEVQQLKTAVAEATGKRDKALKELREVKAKLAATPDAAQPDHLLAADACERLALKYKDLEARFCTPHITPESDGWDSHVAAEFIRSAKTWCIAHQAATAEAKATIALSSAASVPSQCFSKNNSAGRLFQVLAPNAQNILLNQPHRADAAPASRRTATFDKSCCYSSAGSAPTTPRTASGSAKFSSVAAKVNCGRTATPAPPAPPSPNLRPAYRSGMVTPRKPAAKPALKPVKLVKPLR
ncbi:hypothetical protein DIPPA_15617 [Diplonema papillatum]|nr:hypothetical protein DIPPA_15617 [Diplonema papillatum]